MPKCFLVCLYLCQLILFFYSGFINKSFADNFYDINAVYYETTQILSINDVTLYEKHYYAELKPIEDSRFELIKLVEIPNKVHEQASTYQNNILNIPTVFVLNQLFSIQLKYEGSNLFSLYSAFALSNNNDNLNKYLFSSYQTKLLQGLNTDNSTTGFNCKGIIYPEDVIANLTLVSIFYQNGCYTEGEYNDINYWVKQGIVTNGRDVFDAYEIKEPMQKATDFLASKHVIYYKFSFSSIEDYTIYELSGDTIRKVKNIPASSIQANQFTKIDDLFANDIKTSTVYFFAPSRVHVNQFTELAEGIEGAMINSNIIGDVFKYRLAVEGKPFDTDIDFNYGPDSWANIYGVNKHFFVFKNPSNNITVIWQDTNNYTIYQTDFDPVRLSYSTTQLSNDAKEILAAATMDTIGNVYYLTVEPGDGSADNKNRMVTLYKIYNKGNTTLKKTLDASNNGLNMVYFGDNNMATLEYLKGQLGLIIGRKMHKSTDGSNHQGAIAVIFDAATLEIIKNLGQTSGHSFGNMLTTYNDKFIGLDLGDNYPRGINLHKFDRDKNESKVIFTFKTEHSKQAINGGKTYPYYPEISNQDTLYYQWSNDNRTYTELGGVIPYSDGYCVVFASEADDNGYALDNSRVRNNLNDPRNIGIVKVVSDFQNTSGSGNVVSDDLILTSGITETGGFYNYNGGWEKQRNTGVVWLTNYKDKNLENASRVKSVKLQDNSILVLWEKWTADSYINTYVVKVDSMGNKLTEVIQLGNRVRLDRSSDIKLINNRVYIIAGNSVDRKMEITTIGN